MSTFLVPVPFHLRCDPKFRTSISIPFPDHSSPIASLILHLSYFLTYLVYVLTLGAPNTFEHRIYFEKNGVVVSPWHDIPLLASSASASPQIFNMVVEIPRWSNAKKEISKDDDYNPIKQDIKKGKLRFVRNCFPHHGYPFTYGALPQV